MRDGIIVISLLSVVSVMWLAPQWFHAHQNQSMLADGENATEHSPFINSDAHLPKPPDNLDNEKGAIDFLYQLKRKRRSIQILDKDKLFGTSEMSFKLETASPLGTSLTNVRA